MAQWRINFPKHRHIQLGEIVSGIGHDVASGIGHDWYLDWCGPRGTFYNNSFAEGVLENTFHFYVCELN